MPDTRQLIALITGASSGIGRAISVLLSTAGYHCVLVSRDVDKLTQTERGIQAVGGTCTVIPADISSAEQIEDLYERTSALGFVSVIVNNAGFGKFSKFEESTIEDWDAQMAVNLRGAFLISRKFVPAMQKHGQGTLIFMNSVAGKRGYPFSAAYVASKYGLRGLAESLREELRKDNIRVISVHPGAIDTPFWDDVKTDFPREEMLTPQMVASSVVHAITSPEPSVIEELVLRRVGGDF